MVLREGLTVQADGGADHVRWLRRLVREDGFDSFQQRLFVCLLVLWALVCLLSPL